MNVINNNIALKQHTNININPTANVGFPANTTVGTKQNVGFDSFQQIFDNHFITDRPLQFSKHAEMRLTSRDISFTGEQMKRISDGVSRANEKGIKDSLVLVDDVALLVNIRSKVVVTAMDKNDNVFTNIDGAVIV